MFHNFHLVSVCISNSFLIKFLFVNLWIKFHNLHFCYVLGPFAGGLNLFFILIGYSCYILVSFFIFNLSMSSCFRCFSCSNYIIWILFCHPIWKNLHFKPIVSLLFYKINRYGEIVNINLVRDKKTGKSKGFCFLCYEDQRSTILAVDNFNGIKVSVLTKQDLARLLSYSGLVSFFT